MRGSATFKQPNLLMNDDFVYSPAGSDVGPHSTEKYGATESRKLRSPRYDEARRARRAKRRREQRGAGAEAYAALLTACRAHTHDTDVSQTALFETSGGETEQTTRDDESLRLWINDVSNADREFGEAEAALILSNIGFTLPPRDFEDIFDIVDDDNSGTLSHDELPRLLHVYRELGWSHHVDPYGGVAYHVKRATAHHAERVVWEGARSGVDDGSDSEDDGDRPGSALRGGRAGEGATVEFGPAAFSPPPEPEPRGGSSAVGGSEPAYGDAGYDNAGAAEGAAAYVAQQYGVDGAGGVNEGDEAAASFSPEVAAAVQAARASGAFDAYDQRPPASGDRVRGDPIEAMLL